MSEVNHLHSRKELIAWLGRESLGPLHYVPTMGALHQGHQHLIRRACQTYGNNAPPRVLCSVFVNPLQFGPGEDFDRYPRDLGRDAAIAAEAGATALFAPSVEDVFPGGENELTRVLPPPALQRTLCGRLRPGHFDGVATVVCRLLSLIKPDRVYLGEKDWQQLVILRRVVADLALPVKLVGCATIREPDGLACSSRNSYLSPSERTVAAVLPKALAAAHRRHRQGERQAGVLEAEVHQRIHASAPASIEYVETVEPRSLSPLKEVSGMAVLAAAVTIGGSRLIDHVVLMNRSPIVAIDGPAGAGKSTVTRAFARRLGLLYLDTGAMYRATTWWVLRQGVDPVDGRAVAAVLQDLELTLGGELEEGGQQVTINGHEVGQAIRSPDVTSRVSTVAAHRCVRDLLTRLQQRMGKRGGLVAEGRDIGTAVFPDADCKVFLTATVAERARRRAEDLRQRGFPVPPLDEMMSQIEERDHLDSSRSEAPLRRADDASELVTDGMAIETVIQELVDLFREKVPEEAWSTPLSQGQREHQSDRA